MIFLYGKKILATCTCSVIFAVFGQEIDSTLLSGNINYATYIERMEQNNLEYLAEKMNLNIAETYILDAQIVPDPELAFSVADNGQKRLNMGYGFGSELTWTIELAGKRKARIQLAENHAKLDRLTVENYFIELRKEATLSYLLALKNKHLFEIVSDSYHQMNQLAKSDSIRASLGEIAQMDAQQSKVEAMTMLNELYEIQKELHAAVIQLNLLMGQQNNEFYVPNEQLQKHEQNFILENLMEIAQNKRIELEIAQQQLNVSKSLLKLTKANRVIDLGVSLSVQHNAYVRNIIAPTPSFTTLSAGVSIPLKFSNNKMGDVKTSHFMIVQNEYLYQQIDLQIMTEVKQAFYNYRTTLQQVDQFSTNLLSDAENILNGKIYAYQRGEISLIEVLNAQRTHNEVQQNYYETLYQNSEAFVELQRAVGTWEVNF